jgi:hypothetical protein
MEFEMMPLEYTGSNYIGFSYELADYDDDADFRFFAAAANHIYFDFSNRRIDQDNINFVIN